MSDIAGEYMIVELSTATLADDHCTFPEPKFVYVTLKLPIALVSNPALRVGKTLAVREGE